MKLLRKLKRAIFQGRKLKQLHNIKGHLGLKEGRLLFKIAKSLKENSVVVEIGAFLGKSTCFIAEGIGPKKIDFYTIDTWRNEKMLSSGADVFSIFWENIKPYRDKVISWRGFSYELVKNWPPQRKIDFLWIDGDHSYEGVKRDIQDWLPLVRKNSVVCFHDYCDAEGVKRAVDEAVREGKIRFVRMRNNIYMAKRN